MLDMGQTFEEGLAFAESRDQSLVFLEVTLVLLHVLALDSDRPEKAKGQPSTRAMPRRSPTSSALKGLPARAIRSEVPASLSTPMATVSHQPAPGTRTPVSSLLAAARISAPGWPPVHHATLRPWTRARRRRRPPRTSTPSTQGRPSSADSSSDAAVSTARNSASCCAAQPREAIM